MYFKKIILHKYKRFAMHSENTFETDLHNFNILNWRNGFGKSSLIFQVNVLPIDKKDFDEDGYKEIYFTHNHKEYVIKSYTNKHSITEDGEELNVSFNKKTFLEIIKDKFKITPNVLNYVNGYSTLTNMSPNERKEVLFNISQLDYSYALGVFNTLATMHRDSIALLKYNSGKLNNIMEMSKEDVTKEDYVIYRKYLEAIKEFFLKNHYDVSEEQNLQSKIDELYSTFSSLGKDYAEEEIKTLTNTRDELNASILVKQKEREAIQEKIEMLNQLVDDELLKTKQATLIEKEKILNESLTSLDNQFIKDSVVNGNLNILDVLKNIINLLEQDEEVLNTILDNEFENKLAEKNKTLDVSRNIIKSLKDMLENVSNLNKVKCDNCGHHIDMNLKQEKLKTEINQREMVAAKLEDEVVKENKTLLLIKRKQTLLANLNIQLTMLNENKLDNIDQIKQQELFSEYSSLYVLVIELFRIKDDIKLLKDELVKLSNKGSMSADKTKLEMTNCLSRDKILVDEIIKCKNQVKNINETLEQASKRKEKKERLKNEYKVLMEMKTNNYRVAMNQFISNSVRLINSELENIDKNIKHLDMLEVERKNLIEEIAKITEDIKDYKMLIDKLSPKNGLIAKSINSFIGVIVEEMNTIINTVWSYDMRIMNCDVDDGGDLDFKFKVLINNTRTANDVSNLSTSMRDIVDLAFRLIYIKYMDLDGIPLVLDEFGSSMDKEHASKAFDMIEDVLRNSFEQILLVSHFDTMYGRFRNVNYLTVK